MQADDAAREVTRLTATVQQQRLQLQQRPEVPPEVAQQLQELGAALEQARAQRRQAEGRMAQLQGRMVQLEAGHARYAVPWLSLAQK